MREICIKTVEKKGKEHIVRLGNGTVHKFSSEKAARKFLADTNRFLSGIFFSCNQILTELYKHTREVWIISSEIKEHHGLDQLTNTLEHHLKQSYFRSDWEAGNLLSFIDMRKFTERAKDLIKFLHNVKYVKQTDSLRRHRLDELFNQVHGLQMQLMNYRQLEAYELFSITKLDYLEDITPKTHLKIA